MVVFCVLRGGYGGGIFPAACAMGGAGWLKTGATGGAGRCICRAMGGAGLPQTGATDGAGVLAACATHGACFGLESAKV